MKKVNDKITKQNEELIIFHTSLDGDSDDDDCMCDFPPTCDGSGMLDCLGCGGDLCVCICGGEFECFGCADCSDSEDEEE